jgi:hypothetical protein
VAAVVMASGAVLLAAPAASADSFAGYEIAFQSSDHHLSFIAPGGAATQAVAGLTDGTSVSLTGLSNGDFLASFVVQGQLWVGNSTSAAPHTCNGNPYLVRGGSSPSSPAIAASPTGDWETLAAISDGNFVHFGPGNQTCGPEIQPIFPAVSGDVAPVSTGGMVEALMGTSGQLLFSDLFLHMTAVTLDNGTAPAIAGDHVGGPVRIDGWKVAAHGADDRLWTVDSAGNAVQTSNALKIGSGVAIATLSGGGYEIVFAGSDGHLRKMAPDGTVSLVGNGLSIAAHTAPSIAADFSGGFEIAFQSVQGHLVTVDQNDVVHDTFQNMPVNTSPDITALINPVGPSPSPTAPTPTPSPSSVPSQTPTPTPTPSCASTGQQLVNPGFETGATGWTATPAVILQGAPQPPRSGSWDAWLDGYGSTHTDTLSQPVTILAGCHATLWFWLHIDTAEATQVTAFDTLTVQVNSTTLFTWSNLNAAAGYTQRSFDLSSFAGQTVTVKFTGAEDLSLQTSFVVDDTSLTTS